MKSASVSEIKKELGTQTQKELVELCLRLAKYKKENKDLLNYLLFEAHDEAAFIEQVKAETDEQFRALNKSQVYLAKKTIRKALRTTDRNAKFSKIPQTEIELRLHFCRRLRETGIKLHLFPVLQNLYIRQAEKIKSIVEKLHEDLQSDFNRELREL